MVEAGEGLTSSTSTNLHPPPRTFFLRTDTMPDAERQKDAMDVLQAWVDQYNGRAGPTIRLGSAGEAGGAQLRLKYSPAEGQVSILHMVAVNRDGRAAILVRRFEGSAAEAAVEAGLWASTQLGRRPGA
jgi:hypothetical protein